MYSSFSDGSDLRMLRTRYGFQYGALLTHDASSSVTMQMRRQRTLFWICVLQNKSAWTSHKVRRRRDASASRVRPL